MKIPAGDPMLISPPHSTGKWGNDVTWEVYVTTVLPPLNLCTAVMCIAITDNKIVLARSERGWGLLGGHIEDGETLEAALRREALEEGGFAIARYKQFAVRKITSYKPMPHQRPGKMYPFPTGYIVYYLATTTQPLQKPTGEEIIESDSFAFADLHSLHSADEAIITLGWKMYVATRMRQ